MFENKWPGTRPQGAYFNQLPNYDFLLSGRFLQSDEYSGLGHARPATLVAEMGIVPVEPFPAFNCLNPVICTTVFEKNQAN